jgi:hypothetical protein
LREAALGDVERAHDFEAAGDGVLELDRRLHLLHQHAVDAVADAELLLVGLDVDVARALLDRVEEDGVDEADDRRALGLLLQLHEVDVVTIDGEIDLFLGELREHVVVVRGAAGVVGALDRGDDPGLRGHDRLDVEAREELDVVDGVEVRRIGHGHDERRAGARERDDLVLLADLARDELDEVGLHLVLVQVDRGDAVLGREEMGDFPVGNVAELCQGVAEVRAVLALLFLRLAELLEADELLADEELAEAVGGRHPVVHGE